MRPLVGHFVGCELGNERVGVECCFGLSPCAGSKLRKGLVKVDAASFGVLFREEGKIAAEYVQGVPIVGVEGHGVANNVVVASILPTTKVPALQLGSGGSATAQPV